MAKKIRAAPTPMSLDQLDSYGIALLENAQSLIEDAEVLLVAGRYPRAYALCTLAIEEAHKPPIAWFLMKQIADGIAPDWTILNSAGTSHVHKLTIAVASHFALSWISPQLMTLPDTATLQKMMAESQPFVQTLNQKKQAALYTDLADGNPVLPRDSFDQETATAILGAAKSTVKFTRMLHVSAKAVITGAC